MNERVNGQPQMIYFEWVDSTRNEGWCTRREIDAATALEIKTVGFLVSENDKELTVALCATDPNAGSPYCSLMTVPKPMISLRVDVVAYYQRKARNK